MDCFLEIKINLNLGLNETCIRSLIFFIVIEITIICNVL
jgi:hypothetical protein